VGSNVPGGASASSFPIDNDFAANSSDARSIGAPKAASNFSGDIYACGEKNEKNSEKMKKNYQEKLRNFFCTLASKFVIAACSLNDLSCMSSDGPNHGKLHFVEMLKSTELLTNL
jgi:hypothetical protein